MAAYDCDVVCLSVCVCVCVCDTGSTTVEVCNTETFVPICSTNEVIIIEKALYGRLELGQCVSHVILITVNGKI